MSKFSDEMLNQCFKFGMSPERCEKLWCKDFNGVWVQNWGVISSPIGNFNITSCLITPVPKRANETQFATEGLLYMFNDN